jgi:hypothetical protein
MVSISSPKMQRGSGRNLSENPLAQGEMMCHTTSVDEAIRDSAPSRALVSTRL